MSEESFNISNTTKSTEHQKWSSVPFAKIKDKILGKDYSLSLVFIGEKRSKKLNNTYRQKNKSTNVLSFTLDKKVGEIFITPKVAQKQFKKFDKTFEKFIGFLFIHGCLHLKGMDHGSTMEKAEKKLCKVFGL